MNCEELPWNGGLFVLFCIKKKLIQNQLFVFTLVLCTKDCSLRTVQNTGNMAQMCLFVQNKTFNIGQQR